MVFELLVVMPVMGALVVTLTGALMADAAILDATRLASYCITNSSRFICHNAM